MTSDSSSPADATLVFGHKSPDTDTTGSAILWAWHINEIQGGRAEAVLLGAPNAEAAFMLERWSLPTPRIIDDVAEGQRCVIVDTNNPAELPAGIGAADVRAIIDHHKLVGGLETAGPIEIAMRPLASTATVMIELMGEAAAKMPDSMKAVALTCILSDTLEFRSPTTTPRDREIAEGLAADLGLSIPDYAAEMFAAKSDVSGFSDEELIRMDSKEYTVGGVKFRISVLETTDPSAPLARKAGLMDALASVAAQDGVDEVLLFIVDILEEEATLLIPSERAKAVAEASFGATVSGDAVVLPGIMSRKKQIIPNLAL